MKTSDLIIMCIENLRRRRFRTILTVMGVIIGTTAIISMVSFALGIKQTTDDFISSWGDLSMIDIYPNDTNYITDDVIKEINQMEGVEVATPFLEVYYLPDINLFTGKNDRYKAYVYNLIGVKPETLEPLSYNLKEGDYTSSSNQSSLIFGSYVPYNFSDTKKSEANNYVSPYPDEVTGKIAEPFIDTLNEKYTMKIFYNQDSENSKNNFLEYEFIVSGILSDTDANAMNTQYSIYMNVSDLEKIVEDYRKVDKSGFIPNTEGYSSAKVKVSNIKDVAAIQSAIDDMKLSTHSLEDERQSALKETENLQLILGALGGVSLIVAAISIANTMVMSVYERTKEIGIMKVVGCFVEDIRKMFLFEAAMIGFSGGIVGVILSYLLSFFINFVSLRGESDSQLFSGFSYMMTDSSKVSVIPVWLSVSGVAFATIIGIVAGLYPALRAVKISALEAIKTE